MKRQLLLTLITSILLPLSVLAADDNTVNTFAKIPFLSGNLTTQGFVEALYKMAIGLASIIVVIRLIMAGAKYMLSEVVSSKGQAKEDIKNALFGLLIILGAVLILGTINPKLVGLDVLSGGSPVNLNTGGNDKNTNTNNTIEDNFNFVPGDTHSIARISSNCNKSTGQTSGGKYDECVNSYESVMEQSCKYHKGIYQKAKNSYYCN